MPIDFDRLTREKNNFDQDFNFKSRPPKKKGSCLKLFFALILSGLVVVLAVFFSFKLIIGPTLQKIDQLPQNFPPELALYQADQVKIESYSQKSQEKILALAQKLPDWLLEPLLKLVSDDFKNKLTAIFGNSAPFKKDLTIDDLKQAIKSVSPGQNQTFLLSWDKLNLTKEALADYYREKLKGADFELKENLSDYQINLGFWKDNVFGEMIFKDQPEKTASAQILVNYLNEKP